MASSKFRPLPGDFGNPRTGSDPRNSEDSEVFRYVDVEFRHRKSEIMA